MSHVFEELMDPKLVRILKLLLKYKKTLFHLQKISQESHVPLGTTFRIVQKLVKIKVLDVTIVGKLKLYKLAKNKKTEELELLSKYDIKQIKN